ncbi:MAG TPA: glycosyltransferase 87 family protein [Polyangiaceae bacterium]|nr:glycosyltransferase 87 family protein [Polyangiaceae bacterium]
MSGSTGPTSAPTVRLPSAVVRPFGAGLLAAQRALDSLSSVPSRLPVLLVCAIALLLRLWLSWESVGTNDIMTWQGFATKVREVGVLRTYQLDAWFNHPPLMGYWARLALELAEASALPFPFVFKLLPIAASVATIYALTVSYQLAWWKLLLLASNPVDILIGSYHGNTDCLCVSLCVAALLMANGGRSLMSGLMLAAAINVKLIPVILILPLLASLPSWGGRLRCLLGLALGALPFVPVLLSVFDAFVKNAILYNSFRAYWGFGMLAYGSVTSFPRTSAEVWAFADQGKYLILLSSALYAVLPRVGVAVERAQYLAFPMASFLVFASGFGPQYLVYPLPFLILVRPRLAFAFAYLAGAFAFFLYHWYWTKTFPLYSQFNTNWPDMNALLFGFASWCVLAYFWLDSLRAQAAAFARQVLEQLGALRQQV